MSVTVNFTFEKKHFLILGLIIAIPFLILAITNIIAVAPTGQYHPSSELFVDSDIDLNNKSIINSGNITITKTGNGIIFPDGSIQKTAINESTFNKSTYKVLTKCTGCTRVLDYYTTTSCTPPDETVEVCPVGWTDIFFANHDTDFSVVGALYTTPSTVTDSTLKDVTKVGTGVLCSVTANVIDANSIVLAEYSISQIAPYKYMDCQAWCSYRICQKN